MSSEATLVVTPPPRPTGTPAKNSRRPRGTGSILKIGRFWHIQFYRHGRMFQESSRSEKKTVAEHMLRDRLEKVRQGLFQSPRVERVTFDELAADLLNDYRMNGRRTTDDAESRISNHLLPTFGGLLAAEVTTDRIREYIVKRQLDEAAPGTIQQELALLKRAFKLASQMTPPKVARAPYVPMVRVNNVRKGFIEREQFTKLRDALPEYLKPLLTAAYLTGMRLGELRTLGWQNVDLVAAAVTLDPGTTKNDEPRTIPMTTELLETLKFQLQRRNAECPECPYVFHRNGRPIGDFRKAWECACKEADVPDLLFHDLRRSAVRNMVRAGIPEQVAMKISGHKTRCIFDRYNIVSERDVREAACKLDRYYTERPLSAHSVENRQAQARNWGS
jgi:integrase